MADDHSALAICQNQDRDPQATDQCGYVMMRQNWLPDICRSIVRIKTHF